MVKVHTIEMIEHSAHSTPNVKAHADMINGALVGLGDGVTKAPAAGEELYVVLNTQVGDDAYAEEYPIAKDSYVNLFRVSNWDGKELEISSTNLVDDYDSVNVGSVLTFDPDTFKFKVGTGDIKFTVTKKFGASINALLATISVEEG